ncbi:MAG: sigma-54-dependent Fis family transcriptional regulator [Kiritimatiellae bacterium]|nr:sigma-54-dependent Fis family transcriptional regulator [Kiritimatiellia bacterium]
MKLLVVDDESRILLLLQSLLKANGHEVVTAKDGATALSLMQGEDAPQAVITDLRMAPMDGMTLFHEIHKLQPQTPVILLTAYASVETAIDAMKSGAFDYLTKPFKIDEMLATVKRAEAFVQKHEQAAIAADPNAPLRYQFENLIASSPTMRQVCEMIQKVAPTPATVLLNGESGTGKEVIARTIHNHSLRKEKPWVAVNCAALPENLLESEMFGHVKGAFTGAVSDKEGLFETANGGTLFLDEISSMPLPLQGKLLRVLQEKEIRPVGGTKTVPVDVRVIAASNANLEQLVAQGSFRADLFYRFAVITLDIPALRDRPEDILPLARHFIAGEFGNDPAPRLTQEAADVLLAYKWPGNVRELENAIKHAVTFLTGDEITPDLLPPRIVARAKEERAAAPAPSEATPIAGNASLKSFLKSKEREYLGQMLAQNGGDKEKTAASLQVSLATLYRKLADDDKPES